MATQPTDIDRANQAWLNLRSFVNVMLSIYAARARLAAARIRR